MDPHEQAKSERLKPVEFEFLNKPIFERYLYRYEGERYGTGYLDESGDYVSTGSYYKVICREYGILKETPKGFWIDLYSGNFKDRRFVRKKGIKKFANQTKEGALQDFICRKNKQIKILEDRLRGAQMQFKIALNIASDPKNNTDEDLTELFNRR